MKRNRLIMQRGLCIDLSPGQIESMYRDSCLCPIIEEETGEGKLCAFLSSVKRCRGTLRDDNK